MKQLRTRKDILCISKKENFFFAPEGLPRIFYMFIAWQVDRQQKKIKK